MVAGGHACHMTGGHAWLGGMCGGRGHAWWGCMHAWGVCMAGGVQGGMPGGACMARGVWPGGCMPHTPPSLILRDTVGQ